MLCVVEVMKGVNEDKYLHMIDGLDILLWLCCKSLSASEGIDYDAISHACSYKVSQCYS